MLHPTLKIASRRGQLQSLDGFFVVLQDTKVGEQRLCTHVLFHRLVGLKFKQERWITSAMHPVV